MPWEEDSLEHIFFAHLSSGVSKSQPSSTMCPLLKPSHCRKGVLMFSLLQRRGKKDLWGESVSQAHAVICRTGAVQFPTGVSLHQAHLSARGASVSELVSHRWLWRSISQKGRVSSKSCWENTTYRQVCTSGAPTMCILVHLMVSRRSCRLCSLFFNFFCFFERESPSVLQVEV